MSIDNSETKSLRRALVFDTDAGTDDAVAMLFLKHFGIKPSFMIGTGGNASSFGAVRNTYILNRFLNIGSVVVSGKEKELSEEKNTFHGTDGLAEMTEKLMEKCKITYENMKQIPTYQDIEKELLSYDKIDYICVGPTTTLAYYCSNKEINEKIENIYLMGGGFNEFNCPHDTEFNFFKNPESAKTVLTLGKHVILFPLDLTNHQIVTKKQITILSVHNDLNEYAAFLVYNQHSNSQYNNIDGAVLHDTMPVLYYQNKDWFNVEKANITIDEYAHVEKSDKGIPVEIATNVKAGLLFEQLQNALKGGSI